MSLTLLQSYSSAEDEEGSNQLRYGDSSDDRDSEEEGVLAKNYPLHPLVEPSSAGSLLPSAIDAFSEVAGPPEFLNNCVEEYNPARDNDHRQGWHGRRRNRKERKDLPAGAVVESKAQLVGIHERVRSDIEGNAPSSTVVQAQNDIESTKPGTGKRLATAMNPNADAAAELLRMCVQCGIPKTYSSARGMVCPVCGDRPPPDPAKQQEKKGSIIKEKERSKRMRGQSSHATWKSETEMHLRQQFD